MTKPDGVRDILERMVCFTNPKTRGLVIVGLDKAAHAIREYLAQDLEALKKKIHEPVTVDREGEFQLCECDNCCDNEYYNDIITAAQERIRKGGEG